MELEKTGFLIYDDTDNAMVRITLQFCSSKAHVVAGKHLQ